MITKAGQCPAFVYLQGFLMVSVVPRSISFLFLGSFFTSLCFLSGCDSQIPNYDSAESYPGGDTSVSYKPFASHELPAANMSADLKPDFHAGKALANQPWVKAPTITTARDGLGPIYNSRTCLMCHIKGGKGSIPEDNTIALSTTLVRLSKTESDTLKADQKDGVIPHPIYGDQLQTQSISLAHQLRNSQPHLDHDVAPEAYVHVNWIESTFTYPDSTQVMLRRPELDFRYLGYGELGEDTLIGLRVAPAIHGMGLLELIPQAALDALVDEQDKDQNGISGRINQVWNVETKRNEPGRFGLKANKPTLAMTVAGAFTNDVGITNPLFPNEPCTKSQTACNQAMTGNDDEGVELPQALLDLVIDFNRNLAPAKRRGAEHPTTLRGRDRFYETGCHMCHNPKFVTEKSERFAHLSNQTIWPYTDLLLHDMGPELSDGRPDFQASGSEWRTPPLWGVGLRQEVNGSTALLHDGRARTIEEAILWHGGEAEAVKQKFINLPKDERKALIRFVNSL